MLAVLLLIGCVSPSADPNDTLMLTWADDPTTTMIAQWLTDEDDPPEAALRYAPIGSEQWRTAAGTSQSFGPSDYTLQRVRLFDLTPGTMYRFQLLLDDEAAPEQPLRFRTAPATLESPDQSLTFAEGGDIGTGDIVAKLHEQAAAWDPLFAVVGGDLAYANGRYAGVWVRFLELWREHMITDDRRLIPMIATIGNHEVRGDFGGSRADAPYFYDLFGPLYDQANYTTFDFGDYLAFILLDSGHTTPIAGAQTDWLRRTLQQYATDPPTHLFVVYHVPAYPSHRLFWRGHEDVRQHWVPLMERFGVDLAFEHDDHTYKRTHPLLNGEPNENGLVYLGDGAWGRGPRNAAEPEDRPYLARTVERLHVIRVTITPRQRIFTAVDARGRVIDRYSEPVQPAPARE